MKLIKLLFVFIVGLVLTNVTLTNRSLDQSLQMSELSAEIQSLTKEVSILEAQLASKGSLTAQEIKIKELGFLPPSQIIAVGAQPSSVALR